MHAAEVAMGAQLADTLTTITRQPLRVVPTDFSMFQQHYGAGWQDLAGDQLIPDARSQLHRMNLGVKPKNFSSPLRVSQNSGVKNQILFFAATKFTGFRCAESESIR